MNAIQFQESIRLINCMSPNDFENIFEDNGHLWRKYVGVFDYNVNRLITSLDLINLNKLFDCMMEKTKGSIK